MSITVGIAIAVLLLAANAFFVGAEFAVISVRRSSMEPLAAAGDKRAKTVLWALEHVSLMLACSQLGITACSIALGVVAEPAIAKAIEGPLESMGVSPSLSHPIGFAVALSLVVYLHVVLGEMVPKNMAVSTPDRAALWFGPPLVLIARFFKPVIVSMDWMANHVVKACGIEPRGEVTSAFTATEVRSIMEQSQEEGVLSDEHGLLSGAIEFSDKTAAEVMVPLSDVVGLTLPVIPEDLERAVARTGFSRYPVLGDDGVPFGYLHLKDVLYADEGGPEQRDQPIPSWRTRAMVLVQSTDEVDDVLRVMQRTGAHVAKVVDGHSVAGVLFLEDILEELVGEVRDVMQRRVPRQSTSDA